MGKKSKLKSMTEQERLLYLEQKMLAEQEELRKRTEQWDYYLRHIMNREVRYTRKNLNRINYQWLFIMRGFKSKELLKDIEIMSRTFERIIDRKESVIKSLLKDIDEAEEQFQMAMRSHFQRIGCLIEIETEQFANMKARAEKDAESIKNEFDKERNFILARHEADMNEISIIILGMEKIFSDQESEANIELLSVKDDMKTKSNEEKQLLRVALESRVTDLWSQFNNVMKHFEENNGARKLKFDELKQKDEKSAKEIESQMRKIIKLQGKIEQQKTKVAVNVRLSTERNNSIKEQLDEMNLRFHELKSQLRNLKNEMKKKLIKLSVQTENTLSILKKKKEKAKHILIFAEKCRVLETEEEKILPYYLSTLTDEDREELNEETLLLEKETKIPKEYDECLKFDNFWKHYNKAWLDTLSLEKEQHTLSTENTKLRIILKQYLDGISVNETVMNQINPLLIVNNRTNVRVGIANNNRNNLERYKPDSYNKVVVEARNTVDIYKKHDLLC